MNQTLPSLHDRPDGNVVIFDGHCRFCQGQAARLARWDWRKKLSFISLHDPLVAERWPDLTHEQLMEEMYVVDTGGKRHGGADAFRFISRQLPPLWPLSPILHLPLVMPIARACYRFIARQRYRWGRVKCTDACEIHLK